MNACFAAAVQRAVVFVQSWLVSACFCTNLTIGCDVVCTLLAFRCACVRAFVLVFACVCLCTGSLYGRVRWRKALAATVEPERSARRGDDGGDADDFPLVRVLA